MGGKLGRIELSGNFWRQLYICCVIGPVSSNHGNLYKNLLALVLGHYGVPQAEVNGTE